jgi:hypothetical protein
MKVDLMKAYDLIRWDFDVDQPTNTIKVHVPNGQMTQSKTKA